MYRSALIVRSVARQRPLQRIHRTQHTRILMTKCSRISSCLRPAVEKHVCTKYPGAHGFKSRMAFSSESRLPDHYKITLPALSPTMERGTLVRWIKEEGEQVSEGDLLAEIETDKATMGFETPEDGYIATILVPSGTKDVPVGRLLCIIVSEKSSVLTYKNYEPTAEEVAGVGVVPPPPEPIPEPAVEPPPKKAGHGGGGADYPEHVTVTLPSLSPTMEKGGLMGWSKSVGDEISEGDVLAQIETDKATMDMESSDEGFLAKICVEAGAKDVPVGQILCIIVPEMAQIEAFKHYKAPALEAEPSSAPAPPETHPPSATIPQVVRPVAAAPVAPGSAPSGGRVSATPKARRLADERGFDLSKIPGTGPDGQVRALDVESYVPSAAPPMPIATSAPFILPPAPGATYTDIPVSSMRQVIASRLLQSKTTIPHYYLSIDVQMDQILRLRKELNELLKKEEIKLSVNDFIIKASAQACRKVPEANSSWQDTYIRQYHTVDMSIAVATDAGLITPIVTQADKKGLATINQDVSALAAKAKAGSLQPHEFQGGTFTISNLGMFGIKNFAAVINPPQACILAVGGAEERLVPCEDSEKGYRTATVMGVTLSCDHRTVDGAVGAQWLAEFKKFMEKPETMLL